MSERIYYDLTSVEGNLGVCFQSAYSIYHLFRADRDGRYPLALIAYVASSMLQGGDPLPDPPEGCTQHTVETLMPALSKKLERLAALYQDDSYQNPFLIERTVQLIDQQYPTISLRGLAEQLQLNPSYLSGTISSNTGCTFSTILFCRKLFTFVSLVLADPTANFEGISYQLGYKSVHHFSKSLKIHTGMSPSMLRRYILLFSGGLYQE